MRKKRGFVLINLVTVLVVMAILSAGSFAGANLYISYQTKMAVEECEVIDKAINVYAKAHKAMQSDSATWDDEKNHIKYKEVRIYPADMDELKDMQDAGMFTQDVDLSKYSYSTNEDRTEYSLEVILPNEEHFKSTGSTK